MEGGVRHFTGIICDIKERKLTEEKAALLTAIVASSDDAIISKTLEGVITSWNDSAERLFGYSAEEAIGQHVNFIIPPEKIEEERYILAGLHEGELIKHLETVRMNKDGRRILLHSPYRSCGMQTDIFRRI